MSEIDAEIIKKTKETLEKYIKKPPLTEKLLSRPPFRFLHDIVTSVINASGFMKGLFTEEEMNSDNVKEKGAKICFLKKLIGIVSLVLNTPINVNPTSIVAGKEAENTNFLLQSLAKAISKKVDNDIYVKKTLAGEADKLTISKVSNTPVDSKTSVKQKSELEKSKHSDKSKHRQNTESVLDESKKPSDVRKSKEKQGTNERSNDIVIEEKSKDKIVTEEKSSRRPRKERIENEAVLEKEKKEEVKLPKSKSEKRVSHVTNNGDGDVNVKQSIPESISETKAEENVTVDNDLDSSKRMARPSSAKGTRHRHENDHPVLSDDKENDKKRSMMRPPSARPAPPKVRRSSEAGLDDTMNNQTKVSGLIIDVDRDSDDDGYVVEEYVGGGDIDVKFSHTNIDTTLEDNEKHGSLVQSIMQSKKEFINKDKIDTVSHSDVQRKRERLSTEKEIEKIRHNLQAVTKSVNPLGKLIDFIQEDLDTMQKESERWHNENDELEKSLLSEQSVTNKLLKPLKEKLDEQNKIRMDQEEAVAKLKANIVKNSKKIETMLLNSCSSRA